MAWPQWYASGSPQERAAKVLGKAVHPAAFERLFELWPEAVVKVRRDVNATGNRRTTVFITPEPGRYTESGVVSCDSSDQFTRAYGIREAFRRALIAARVRWTLRESGQEPPFVPPYRRELWKDNGQ